MRFRALKVVGGGQVHPVWRFQVILLTTQLWHVSLCEPATVLGITTTAIALPVLFVHCPSTFTKDNLIERTIKVDTFCFSVSEAHHACMAVDRVQVPLSCVYCVRALKFYFLDA